MKSCTTLHHLEQEITAGAIAVTPDAIAVGTYDGNYLLFERNSLKLIFRSLELFGASCTGVQTCQGGVILLGQKISSNLSQPKDWQASLIKTEENKLIRQLPLPAGNWAMVKNINSNLVCLYDRSEKQGIIAADLDKGCISWRAKHDPDSVSYEGQNELVALGDRLSIVDLVTGEAKNQFNLPESDAVIWTSAICTENSILLGGYTVCRTHFVFSLWDKELNHNKARRAYPLSRFLSEIQIERSMAEEDCCGVDIFRVAAMRSTVDKKHFIAALGGDGESLGACSGYSLLAKIDAHTLELLDFSFLNLHDGVSGLLVTEDRAIVNACSSIHSLPL